MNTHRGAMTALAAAIVSGFAVFVNGLAVRRFEDATVYTTAKNLVAGLLLAAGWWVWSSRSSRSSHAIPADRASQPVASWRLMAIAVIGGSVPFVLFFEGLKRATSTDAAFIHKTLVVWVAILAVVILRERLTAWHLAAIGLLIVGQAVLAGGVDDLAAGRGELMILLATLCWSVEVVIAKQVMVSVPSGVAAAVRMAGGSLVLLVWLASTGRLADLAALDGRQFAWLALTGSTLAVFVSVWYRALASAPAIDVSAILVVGAVVTGVLDVGFRDATITTRSLGWVLIVAAASLIALRSAGERRTPVAAV